jgi:hypothetical protein
MESINRYVTKKRTRITVAEHKLSNKQDFTYELLYMDAELQSDKESPCSSITAAPWMQCDKMAAESFSSCSLITYPRFAQQLLCLYWC